MRVTHKNKPHTERKYSEDTLSDRELLFTLCKENLKFSNKKPSKPIKTWTKNLSINNVTQKAHKYMKTCSIWFFIRELQIKTTMRYIYTPLKLLKSKKMAISNVGKDVEQQELSSSTGENEKWHNPLWKTVWPFPTKLNIVFSDDFIIVLLSI